MLRFLGPTSRLPALDLDLDLDLQQDITRLVKGLEALSEEGVNLPPQDLSLFQNLPSERRHLVLQKLERDVELYQSASAAGVSKSDGIGLLKHFLKKMNWACVEDVFSQMTNEDVIEVYSPNLTQLFRNTKFLEVCSYSLFEIYLHEWTELYSRPQSITDQLIQAFFQSLQASPTETFFGMTIPDHFLEELFSSERRVFSIDQKFNSPIRSIATGEIVAVVGVLRARVQSKGTEGRSIIPLGKGVTVGAGLHQ